VIATHQKLLSTYTYSTTWYLTFSAVKLEWDIRCVTPIMRQDLQGERLTTDYQFQVSSLVQVAVTARIQVQHSTHACILLVVCHSIPSYHCRASDLYALYIMLSTKIPSMCVW
jgi:hypothetical protein